MRCLSTLTVLASFRLHRCLFSKRKETKLNNLEVLLFSIFLEMKSHRAHEYVAAINLHSYILTDLGVKLGTELGTTVVIGAGRN
jgi:hypothetical protein